MARCHIVSTATCLANCHSHEKIFSYFCVTYINFLSTRKLLNAGSVCCNSQTHRLGIILVHYKFYINVPVWRLTYKLENRDVLV